MIAWSTPAQVKPPAYLLVSPMPRVNVTSILDLSEGKGKGKTTMLKDIIDPSAVSAINPKTWPALEQTVLNGPQVSGEKIVRYISLLT